MLKVTFTNHQVGYSSGSTHMRGYSSVSYGTSVWNPALGSQAVTWTGTHEQYAVMIRDLALAWAKPMRKWVPLIIEQEAPIALPPDVQEFLGGYNLAMDGQELPDAASVAAELGFTLVKNRSELIDKIPDNSGEVTLPAIAPLVSPAASAIKSPTEYGIAKLLGVGGVTMSDRKPKRDDSQPLPSNTPYLAIKAAAKRGGIDISGCKTNQERIAIINEKRAQLVAQ